MIYILEFFLQILFIIFITFIVLKIKMKFIKSIRIRIDFNFIYLLFYYLFLKVIRAIYQSLKIIYIRIKTTIE